MQKPLRCNVGPVPGSILEGGGQILRNACSTGSHHRHEHPRGQYQSRVGSWSPAQSQCCAVRVHAIAHAPVITIVWHAAMAGMVHLSSTLSCGLLGELYMWRVGKSVEVHNWDHKGCIKNATRAAPTSPRSVLQAEEARPASSAFGRPGTHCEDLRRSATRRPGELQCHSAAAGAPAVQERPRGHRHRRQLCIASTGAASCDHRTMCC